VCPNAEQRLAAPNNSAAAALENKERMKRFVGAASFESSYPAIGGARRSPAASSFFGAAAFHSSSSG